MSIRNLLAYRLALIATILAFIATLLGIYLHLHDAGLSCPDWPGCYGQFFVPKTLDKIYLNEAANINNAWQQMIHRYIAGTVAVLVLILAVLTFYYRRLPNQPLVLSFVLAGLVIIQALLGKWAVTTKLLPIIVTAHLLVGIIMLVLLGLMTLRLNNSLHNNLVNKKLGRAWLVICVSITVIALSLVLGSTYYYFYHP